MFEKRLDETKNNFFQYLSSLGLSLKSHKNYRSDLNHFMEWVILKIHTLGSYPQTLNEIAPFLSKDLAFEYRSYMSTNSCPSKTVNRRLSTLRHLGRFLLLIQAVDENFMKEVENISETKVKKPKSSGVIREFQGYLESEKISKNTVKNYVSDIRQFLTWLESNQLNN